MQPVDACYGLDQRVFLQWFVDVQHCVARFVKAGQQLVDHDQEIRRAFGGKRVDRIAFVVFRILIRQATLADVVLPPLQYFR